MWLEVKMKKFFLFNTLGKRKQEFKPIKKGEVSMYSCGPTVYNFLHIGNLRAYTFADVLKRVLIYNGYKVKHVMNITDIGHIVADADIGEDKMVNALMREKKPMTLAAMKEVANTYYEKSREDMQKMNILPADDYPFASEHIKDDIAIIEALLKKGTAYKTASGIYFDTKKFPNYGVLGGAIADNGHSRIGIVGEKRHPEDFVLWKPADETGLGYDSPFGKGFPGWHIECSAMSMKYLGVSFDIHTGGIDLIPVHHNNEIAQSESYTGKQFVRYWLHNAFITIGDDEKMAKSGENFITLHTLGENGIHSLAYRYWLLTARYSTRMDYSLEAISAAQVAYERLHECFRKLGDEIGVINSSYQKKFLEAINDDLDTPKALALVWELVKDVKISDEDKKATFLDFDRVLGLMLGHVTKEKVMVTGEVQKLLDLRQKARVIKDWTKADEFRKEIEKHGFAVKDGNDGTQTLTKTQ